MLPRLAVGTVATAEAAILAEFQPFRGLLFILLRVIVAPLALRAGEDDHHAILFLGHNQVPTLKKRTPGPFNGFMLPRPHPRRKPKRPLATRISLPARVSRLLQCRRF